MITKKVTSIMALITGIFGVFVATCYIPFSPWYFLGTLTEAEIGIWAVIVLLFSVALGVLGYINKLNKFFALVLTGFLLILQVGAIYLYQTSVFDGVVIETGLSFAKNSWYQMPTHIIFVLALLTYIVLVFVKKETPKFSGNNQE